MYCAPMLSSRGVRLGGNNRSTVEDRGHADRPGKCNEQTTEDGQASACLTALLAGVLSLVAADGGPPTCLLLLPPT